MNERTQQVRKALTHLQNANYAGYFEEMRPIIPDELTFRYNQLREEFISGAYPFNFHQKLMTFAQSVDEYL